MTRAFYLACEAFVIAAGLGAVAFWAWVLL